MTVQDHDITAATDTANLPQPIQPLLKHATYKAHTTDFIVNELLPLEFTGEGEHLWLHIQKSGMNTAYLAKLLSEWADIPLRDVGFSGLKDRHALTTQWFSLRIPKKQLPDSEFAPVDIGANESITILEQQWHNKKLNRGTHRANQFIITLRDIEFVGFDTPSPSSEQLLSVKQAVEQHLVIIGQSGVPNYFGPQRFGRSGNNIREALSLFARPVPEARPPSNKGKRKRVPREQNTMELSAARSLIFNEILAARVRDGSWNHGLAGEVFNLDGSGSIFASDEIDDTLRARLESGDIHPTAVLWGTGNEKVSGKAAAMEADTVAHSPLLTQLATGLEQRDIKAQRRALRLPIEALSWEWQDTEGSQILILNFTLTTGSFATSVLASLVQELNT
ncbi:tRNA pseudouridine(13) synthase TruD [Psychrobacter cryohalolentis]|uniref:tRNA pseudouridine synthase D n=1 Tax=Psychrobacter cryohalolentis (strain ATCC BAA-1226 / DSM 17306 / VKM B-2378 / K5) TaxID=335284 RepID=Q1Q9A5_PSYCK|nr:tRNA pseudouridine(13) synthase TruD [Psychrobacter cryohalolentis]ABE75748.1 Pseudouridylate synthase [Psychrobacter cryohalolentis K5]ASE25938.1 tRNA pseudouridine(13) synthase TruD [Psychrobacter cryohalolentis]